ncbi:hypothetical protein ABQ284_04300 [Lentilactobacillus buchneri]|uniref:hypothetical protein n=1 Tax=Lentilactobacillus buchneri TaxID=1581 RepID=UPI0030F31FC2
MDRATTGITTTKKSSIAESLTIDMLSGSAIIANHPKSKKILAIIFPDKNFKLDPRQFFICRTTIY